MFVCRNVPPGHHGLLLSGSSPRPLHLILHGCRTSDWLRHPIARARVRTHPLRFDHGYGELLRARVVVFRLDAQSPASCSINFSKSEHVFICTRAHMILSAALSRGLCLSFITLASVLTPPLPGVALDAALANDRCTISQCPLIFRMRCHPSAVMLAGCSCLSQRFVHRSPSSLSSGALQAAFPRCATGWDRVSSGRTTSWELCRLDADAIKTNTL